MANAYSRLVRRLLSPIIKGDRLFHIPLPLAHLATGCWKLELIARRARLSLLTSLVSTGPELLWATLQAEATWFAVVQDDLRWFVGDDAADWPQLEAAGWPERFAYIKARPACFKRRVVRRLKAMHMATCATDAVHVCHWAMSRMVPASIIGADAPLVWKCWPCNRDFDTKAKLSVHFFKSHSRVAGYRLFAKGTFCRACGKEYWSGGRLAAHLRASPRCTETLRATVPAVDCPEPGFGSKIYRQKELEQFTLAVPQQVGPVVEANGANGWMPVQCDLYRELCDLAFDNTEGADFQFGIREILKRFPAYPGEIQVVVEFLAAEIEVVFVNDAEGQWSREYVDAMRLACRQIVAAVRSPLGVGEPQLARAQTFEDFHRRLQELDWEQIIRGLAGDGTQPIVLYILPDPWEAEWGRCREAFGSSAVLDQPLAVLPPVLQEAWHALLSGQNVQLRAPNAFWKHPLAGPFWPLRESPASN